MSAVIEIENVRKRYVRFRRAPVLALDGLSLSVPQGGVYGFLGPNGSGKTTTIRCLLGLAPTFEGSARLFGVDVRHGLAGVISRVGAIVEQPALFPGFTGSRNLTLLAGAGGVPRSRVTTVLDRVGLAERGDDLVKGYSLGMRQRLAIAAALLKDPELLILDEPANGLDPAGIREVRDLLRSLAAEGRTVFVSSHILSEIQQVADRVAILTRGRCIKEGPVAEVLSGGGAEGVLVRVDDPGAAREALEAKGFEVSEAGEYLRVAIEPGRASSVAQALAGKRLYPSELRPDEQSLEEVFLALTEAVDEPIAATGVPTASPDGAAS